MQHCRKRSRNSKFHFKKAAAKNLAAAFHLYLHNFSVNIRERDHAHARPMDYNEQFVLWLANFL
jgi:hypothetical protein